MSAYIGFARQKEYCDVQFCLDDPSVEEMSNKLAEISGAQMTPKNWAVLISFYLEQNRPELLEDYTCDSDEDTYFAFYPATKQGEINGKNLVGLIKSLLRNIELLYQFVKETSDEIDWQ